MICENCGTNHDGSYGSGRFCSNKCARCFSTKNKRNEINEKVSKTLGGLHYTPREKYCVCCGKPNGKTAYLYCSFTCQHEYLFLSFINKWKLGILLGVTGTSTSNYIKKYLLLKHDNKCQKCGWCSTNEYTGNIPLELHHINGDYKNNEETNLELLCPNCHSLTSTYKASNKNSTRNTR